MATIQMGTTYKLQARVKYSDNGTEKTGTRTLGITEKADPDSFANDAAIEAVVRNYQPIITDTITSYEVIVTKQYTAAEGQFGTAGSVASAWDSFDDVKLINQFTDGDKTYRETIKRPATAATEGQFVAYANSVSDMATEDLTAISGNFTGSTVSSAWTND